MKRIMIIDREESVREALGAFSEILGFEPTLVSDPVICHAMRADKIQCEVKKPCADILLVGQDLSPLTGLQFVARQEEKCCRVPIHRKAVMSGSFTKEEFMQARHLGCHVLQKPVTFEILENWLDGLTGNRV